MDLHIREFANKVFKVLAFVLLIAIMMGKVNTFAILTFFFIGFIFLSKDAITIISIFAIAPLLGHINRILALPFSGTLIALILIIIVQRENVVYLIKKDDRICISYIIIVIMILLFYYFFTGKTEYSTEKVLELLFKSIGYTIGIMYITQSDKKTIEYSAVTFL